LGKLAPTAPTVFEYFRRDVGALQSETWVVASNKALTSLIGASSVSSYGPAYGANVIFPKQLMITAVENAIWRGRNRSFADRAKVQMELEEVLQGSNYEDLGWNDFGVAEQPDPHVCSLIHKAITSFVQTGGPTSGDELTFYVSRELMRKFAPTLMVVIFSDVEVAHFGSYSLHLTGIQTADRLTRQLWQEVQANPEYCDHSTMVILSEFGRNADGSTTNGFLNHRTNEDSTRTTWMMCLGSCIEKPQMVERAIRHIDLCPTLAASLGCKVTASNGNVLEEFRI
jgi:hypothetical protein